MTYPPNFPTQWRQHPVSYIVPAMFGFTLIIATALFGASLDQLIFAKLGDPYGELRLPLLIVIWLIVLVIAMPCFIGLKPGLCTTWWLDEDKVNELYSFISRSNDELHYHRIDEVSLHQGLLGRLFGYGTIILTPRGKSNRWYIPNAPYPNEMRSYFSSIATQNKQERSSE